MTRRFAAKKGILLTSCLSLQKGTLGNFHQQTSSAARVLLELDVPSAKFRSLRE